MTALISLKPAESTREQELERLLGLGAREVADRRRPDDRGGSCSPTLRATSSASCAPTPSALRRPDLDGRARRLRAIPPGIDKPANQQTRASSG